jgi:hypothetical protein
VAERQSVIANQREAAKRSREEEAKSSSNSKRPRLESVEGLQPEPFADDEAGGLDLTDNGGDNDNDNDNTPLFGLDKLMASKGDGTEGLLTWADLSDPVKTALRAQLSTCPDWYTTLMKSRGLRCVWEKTMSQHKTLGHKVVCKQCAYKQHFCITMRKVNNNKFVVLRPLWEVDHVGFGVDDVRFWLSGTSDPPSRDLEKYPGIRDPKRKK